MKEPEAMNDISMQTQAGQPMEITVYTDPLCCWSWAFEPQLEKLEEHFEKATWVYRMGGLLPSWENFYDEVNSVSRPVQMGPVWLHAGQISNRPIHHQLWLTDPPASSYPSCIAVKCAQLQSDEIGITMLRLLREACMVSGKNIAKWDALLEAAMALAATESSFSVERFKADFNNDNGINAFRADLELGRYHNINRFPTLIIKTPGRNPIMISGYRQADEIISIAESA